MKILFPHYLPTQSWELGSPTCTTLFNWWHHFTVERMDDVMSFLVCFYVLLHRTLQCDDARITSCNDSGWPVSITGSRLHACFLLSPVITNKNVLAFYFLLLDYVPLWMCFPHCPHTVCTRPLGCTFTVIKLGFWSLFVILERVWQT